MNFPLDAILTATPKAAAKRLREAGRELTGKNLRKSSWQEIAEAIQRQNNLAEIVTQRLRAARTRDDALRVLRIVRKAAQKQRRRRAGQSKVVKAPTAAPPRQPEWEDDWEELFPYAYEFWEDPAVYEGYFREWQAEQSVVADAVELLYPGAWPISPLQMEAADFALKRKSEIPPSHLTLRHRLDAATLSRMRAAVTVAAHLNPHLITEADRAFFERYGLSRLLQISAGSNDDALRPVTDGYELAGLSRLDDDNLHVSLPLDWAALTAWLQARLTRPPGEDREAVIRCAYKFIAEAPPAHLRQLLRSAAVEPAWWPLLGYVRQRQIDLLDPNRRGLATDRYPHLSWEDVLALGVGSRLVAHQHRLNYQDLLTNPALSDSSHWSGLAPLLTAGAGSLRRLDYPDFTLTCRPAVGLVSRATFTRLAELARAVAEWHGEFDHQPVRALLARVADQSRQLHGYALPDPLLDQIGATLEQHAIAYVLLKTGVLAAQLAASPFRLRRRHIRRFQADPPADAPAALAQLRPEHGLDVIIEGLLHALLDHLHDPWRIDSDSTVSLKEPFTVALRQLSLIYNYQPTDLPIWHFPTEDDLARAGDIADLLVQRCVDAPLELVNALRLPPAQGLPRLNGGHATDLERRCRHALREAAGGDYLARVDTDAPVTTYTCRPISKLTALDRGQLGGDCSSETVPFRALLPHHVYYGLFRDGAQQRGYMTVYEAWAELVDGERQPVLCLETINAPLEPLRAVQQDLLLLFEGVAASRGLSGGLVLIMSLGTWNYYNREILNQCRRHKQGTVVWLHPADPVQWRLYEHLAAEASSYNAFDQSSAGQGRRHFKRLAPFDPAQDTTVQPENLAEAKRLAALPPRRLITTVRGEAGPLGFISGWPEEF